MRSVLTVSVLCLGLVGGLEKDALAATKVPAGKNVQWTTYGGAHQNIFTAFKHKSYKTVKDTFGVPDEPDKIEVSKAKNGIDTIWCHYSGVHIVDLQNRKAQKVVFKIFRYSTGLTSVDDVILDTSNMLCTRDQFNMFYGLGKNVKDFHLRGLLNTAKHRVLKRRIIDPRTRKIIEEFTDRTLYTYGPLTWIPKLKKHDNGVTITADENGRVIDVEFH